MDNIIIAVLCINLFFVIVFALSCIRKGEKIWLSLLFLALPVLGFTFYFISKIMTKLCGEFSYDRETLVKRYAIEGIQTRPNVSKELDLIPVEDAMAVSSKQERRNLLRAQLKKDLYENYRSILPASADVDSESAHYVAAAKMQVRQQMNGEIIEMQKKMTGMKFDSVTWKIYLGKLSKYIESGLLEKKEAVIYKKDYCDVFEELQNNSEVEKEECTHYLSYMIDLGKTEKAESFWENCSDEQKEEVSYRKMLEMYYNQKIRDKFYACMQQLEQSDIKLSSDGLMIVRFWNRRL